MGTDERSPEELGLAVGYFVEQVACIAKVIAGKPEELDEQKGQETFVLAMVWVGFRQGFEKESVRLFQLINGLADSEVMF